MRERIRKYLSSHKAFLIYIACSIAAAMVDYAVGWVMLRSFHLHILAANTAAILSGAILHYILTSLFVFKVKTNLASSIVYIITFVTGFLLQNGLIWFLYDILLTDFGEKLRYFISKGFSLVIPFLLIFYLRKKLNEKFCEKTEGTS